MWGARVNVAPSQNTADVASWSTRVTETARIAHRRCTVPDGDGQRLSIFFNRCSDYDNHIIVATDILVKYHEKTQPNYNGVQNLSKN